MLECNRSVIADEQVEHLPQALLIKGGFGWIVNIVAEYPHKKIEQSILTALFLMCGQRDSNPHASRHQILSLTWLPITPCPQDLASESLPRAIICGAKIYTFYNICNFIYDFLENFSYFCVLNVSYCVL